MPILIFSPVYLLLRHPLVGPLGQAISIKKWQIGFFF
jgi:hypothetical protein